MSTYSNEKKKKRAMLRQPAREKKGWKKVPLGRRKRTVRPAKRIEEQKKREKHCLEKYRDSVIIQALDEGKKLSKRARAMSRKKKEKATTYPAKKKSCRVHVKSHRERRRDLPIYKEEDYTKRKKKSAPGARKKIDACYCPVGETQRERKKGPLLGKGTRCKRKRRFAQRNAPKKGKTVRGEDGKRRVHR